MAAPYDLLPVIEKKAQEFFYTEAIDVKKISVVRKSDRFSNGDIVIPSGCLGKLETKILCKLRQKIFEELKLEGVPVAKVNGDEFNNVVVYLDRCSIFRETVSLVIKEKDEYGHHKDKRDETILLCNEIMLMNSVAERSSSVSLETLRSSVIQEHIVLLLRSQCYNVSSPVERLDFGTFECIFSSIGTDLSSYKDVSLDREKEKPVIMKFINCPFVRKTKQLNITKAGKEETTCDSMEKKTCVEYVYEFDMKTYIQEKGLNVGKTGFDKNLSFCTVFSSGLPSEVLNKTVQIYDFLQEMKAQSCIHITGQRHAVVQQKVHLILRELGQMNSRIISQRHFVYGPVIQQQDSKNSDAVNVDDFFRMRYAQLKQAALMKYGEDVHGQCWAITLKALTAACIKFEMLSCVPRNTLKLKMCDDGMEGGGTATATGSFVMYNCARLATIFKRFEEEVDKGIYPPLPPVDDVDFSTLREEAEWALLFSYVYTFPELVEQAVGTFDGSDTIYANIHTHKVCQMISSLSRCLSSYYSRYHVLREPRAQLLPTMYARLYLLKSVHQVMINGLALMGIQPISQL